MKLRNKLILSCAALAAVATTAVSTTYAWYTANTTVTADGVEGTTKTSDDSTLLISKTGAVGSWGSKVKFDIHPTDIVPVQYTAAEGNTPESYKTWTADDNEATGTATKGTHYIQFELYFKSGSTQNLDVTLTDFAFEETTTALNPKMVLSNDGLTQSTAGTTYTCNFLRALTYVEDIGASTEVASGSTATMGSTHTRTAYSMDAFIETTDSLSSGCNAHKYYNSVKGLYELTSDTAITSGKKYYTFNAATGAYTEVSSPVVADIATYYECTGIDMSKTNSETLTAYDTTASTRAIGQTGAGSLTGMSPILMVQYTIYLDGWDQYCFDACQGQSFSLAMEFTGATHRDTSGD